jgi:periplasmic protein CpxP/Spy
MRRRAAAIARVAWPLADAVGGTAGNAVPGMPPEGDPYLAIVPQGCELLPSAGEGGGAMRRSIVFVGRAALAAGLGVGWLAAASPDARSAAVVGVPPGREALGPVLPAQAQGQNVEASLAQLHAQLRITPAQEQAFATFANAMRENARMSPPNPPPANADAVSQLQLAIQYGQQEVDGMRRLLPALQTLYAALTPMQRGIANQVFRQGPQQGR